MAKKKASGPNKSAAIRDYYAKNPNAKPKEVEAALTKAGVKTTTAFISTIRSNMKKGKGTGTKKRGRPAGSTARRPGRPAATKTAKRGRPAKNVTKSPQGDVSVAALLKVKKVVEEVGSVDEARAALNALEKLLS